MTIWIEFKYIPKLKEKRLGGVTELQRTFLWDHFNVGVPSYVLIGTDKGHMLYRIDEYDGHAYKMDIVGDTQLMENLKWTV